MPKSNELFSEFQKAIKHEEEFYCHAMLAADTQGANIYWPVLAKRIIHELYTWAVTRTASHRLKFDPKRLAFIPQAYDYGFEYGVGIQIHALPMPKNEWEWESYELFLVSIINSERKRQVELTGEIEQLAKRTALPVRLFNLFGFWWCDWEQKWVWKKHHHPQADD